METASSSKILHLHPEHLDDSVLWNAFRSGDDRALVKMFDMYSQPLYNYGCKITPDHDSVKDSIQELFLDLCRRRSNLGSTDNIRFYLFKALRRRLIPSKLKAPLFFLDHLEKDVPSPETELIQKQVFDEQQQELSNRMSRLTLRQREAIFLRYYEELPYDRIAQMMNLRRQSIYNLINEAIGILKG